MIESATSQAVPGTPGPEGFCRQCGYDLRGSSSNRCPECGRIFDPNRASTFARHPGSPRWRRWSRRVLALILLLLVLSGAAAFALWLPWHRNAAAVRMVERCGGTVRMTTVGPRWLRRFLGRRGSFLLERAGPFCDLSGSTVTDADLRTLDGLSELECLELQNTDVTDAGLESLSRLKGLKSLNLEDTQVTDAGLRYLRDLRTLETLNLAGTGVTDAGMQHLANLKQLAALYLDSANVTDAGLEQLNNLTELQVLSVHGTKVTGAAISALRKKLPQCYIDDPPNDMTPR